MAIIFAAPKSPAHIIAHIPTGPAPITATVSPGFISQSSAPKYPLDRMSPRSKAFLSVTASGILVSPISAKGTRTYSAWHPSIRQPSSQPPYSQLLMNPRLQNQQSPQKVIQFAATRSPGFRPFTCAPHATISPTNSCPRTISSFARGTAPCMTCKSLVHIVDSVTLTIASCGLLIAGTGRSVSSVFPLEYTSAFIILSL